MNNANLVTRAIDKAGGIRPLSRKLNWDAASIVKSRDDEKVSPYRSACLASYVGESVTHSILIALLDTSKSEEEKKYWTSFPTALGSELAAMLKADVMGLHAKWSSKEAGTAGFDKEKDLTDLITSTVAAKFKIKSSEVAAAESTSSESPPQADGQSGQAGEQIVPPPIVPAK